MKYFPSKNLKKAPFELAVLLVIFGIVLSGCVPHIGSSSAPSYSSAGQFIKNGFAAGFPPLPVYKNAKVVESFASNNAFGVLMLSSDNLATVINFYDKSFTPLGWEATFHKTNETNYYYDVKNPNYAGQIIINTAADGKQTAITMSVNSR